MSAATPIEGGFEVGKIGIVRSGDAMPGQKILGKGLGALELGSRCRRAKAGKPAGLEIIDDTVYQGRFGPDDGQFDTLFTGKSEQAVKITW